VPSALKARTNDQVAHSRAELERACEDVQTQADDVELEGQSGDAAAGADDTSGIPRMSERLAAGSATALKKLAPAPAARVAWRYDLVPRTLLLKLTPSYDPMRPAMVLDPRRGTPVYTNHAGRLDGPAGQLGPAAASSLGGGEPQPSLQHAVHSLRCGARLFPTDLDLRVHYALALMLAASEVGSRTKAGPARGALLPGSGGSAAAVAGVPSQLTAAIRELQAAAALNPHSADAAFYLAVAHERAAQHVTGQSGRRSKAVRLSARQASARQAHLDLAFAYASRALLLDPWFVDACRTVAVLLESGANARAFEVDDDGIAAPVALGAAEGADAQPASRDVDVVREDGAEPGGGSGTTGAAGRRLAALRQYHVCAWRATSLLARLPPTYASAEIARTLQAVTASIAALHLAAAVAPFHTPLTPEQARTAGAGPGDSHRHNFEPGCPECTCEDCDAALMVVPSRVAEYALAGGADTPNAPDGGAAGPRLEDLMVDAHWPVKQAIEAYRVAYADADASSGA
jgi:tetratricopeptide (TPR) repeat protein